MLYRRPEGLLHPDNPNRMVVVKRPEGLLHPDTSNRMVATAVEPALSAVEGYGTFILLAEEHPAAPGAQTPNAPEPKHLDEEAIMANSKSRRSRKSGTRQVTHFDEVRGKTVDFVELSLDTESYSIEIRFNHKTELIFDMKPEPGLRVTPDLADWRTGD